MSLPSEQNWLVLQHLITDLNQKGYEIPKGINPEMGLITISKPQIRLFMTHIFKSVNISIPFKRIVITDKYYICIFQVLIVHPWCKDTYIQNRLIIAHTFRQIPLVRGLHFYIVYDMIFIFDIKVQANRFGIIPLFFSTLGFDQSDIDNFKS